MFRQLSVTTRRTFLQSLTLKQSRFQQIQSFSSWNIFGKVQAQLDIREIRKQLNEGGNMDERTTLHYLKALSKLEPNEAANYIVSGWNNQKLAVNEHTVKEFVKALAAANALDKLNVSELFSLYQKYNGGVVPSTENLRMFQQARATPFTAGSSPSEPIYIAYQESGWKSQLWKFGRHAITLFLIAALLSTFLDEKSKLLLLLLIYYFPSTH